jgi:hypothetical protein
VQGSVTLIFCLALATWRCVSKFLVFKILATTGSLTSRDRTVRQSAVVCETMAFSVFRKSVFLESLWR